MREHHDDDGNGYIVDTTDGVLPLFLPALISLLALTLRSYSLVATRVNLALTR